MAVDLSAQKKWSLGSFRRRPSQAPKKDALAATPEAEAPNKSKPKQPSPEQKAKAARKRQLEDELAVLMQDPVRAARLFEFLARDLKDFGLDPQWRLLKELADRHESFLRDKPETADKLDEVIRDYQKAFTKEEVRSRENKGKAALPTLRVAQKALDVLPELDAGVLQNIHYKKARELIQRDIQRAEQRYYPVRKYNHMTAPVWGAAIGGALAAGGMAGTVAGLPVIGTVGLTAFAGYWGYKGMISIIERDPENLIPTRPSYFGSRTPLGSAVEDTIEYLMLTTVLVSSTMALTGGWGFLVTGGATVVMAYNLADSIIRLGWHGLNFLRAKAGAEPRGYRDYMKAAEDKIAEIRQQREAQKAENGTEPEQKPAKEPAQEPEKQQNTTPPTVTPPATSLDARVLKAHFENTAPPESPHHQITLTLDNDDRVVIDIEKSGESDELRAKVKLEGSEDFNKASIEDSEILSRIQGAKINTAWTPLNLEESTDAQKSGTLGIIVFEQDDGSLLSVDGSEEVLGIQETLKDGKTFDYFLSEDGNSLIKEANESRGQSEGIRIEAGPPSPADSSQRSPENSPEAEPTTGVGMPDLGGAKPEPTEEKSDPAAGEDEKSSPPEATTADLPTPTSTEERPADPQLPAPALVTTEAISGGPEPDEVGTESSSPPPVEVHQTTIHVSNYYNVVVVPPDSGLVSSVFQADQVDQLMMPASHHGEIVLGEIQAPDSHDEPVKDRVITLFPSGRPLLPLPQQNER